MKDSIYYKDTLTSLHDKTYISVIQMLHKFESYPFFDSQHARSEILRAVEAYRK